jgi:hypothetical protein
MTKYNVGLEYFNWLTDLVNEGRFGGCASFRKLLAYLHDTEFIYLIPKDENRAADGVYLRYRFACEHCGDEEMFLRGPCSVLEMMVGLAVRCEEDTMTDTLIGDRTSQWFWGMVVNLGLGAMNDDRFDIDEVSEIVEQFLYREYAPDGRGGLFTVRGCRKDLRKVEIWTQLMWYLDTID